MGGGQPGHPRLVTTHSHFEPVVGPTMGMSTWNTQIGFKNAPSGSDYISTYDTRTYDMPRMRAQHRHRSLHHRLRLGNARPRRIESSDSTRNPLVRTTKQEHRYTNATRHRTCVRSIAGTYAPRNRVTARSVEELSRQTRSSTSGATFSSIRRDSRRSVRVRRRTNETNAQQSRAPKSCSRCSTTSRSGQVRRRDACSVRVQFARNAQS
jgi:hypothetical protein